MKRGALLIAVASLLGVLALADEGHHHEDLTDEQLGTVHFPISCAASVQKPFERGIALLHSFWYEEAEKEFTQITKDDPSCALAHWGVAMSLWHQLWDHPSAATIKRGQAELKKAQALPPRTDRERDYLAALRAFYEKKGDHNERARAYSEAMEGMYQHYPDDREAAAFYALSLLASEPDGDSTFANRKKAAAVLEKLFAEEPTHPGVAHYLIHSYDKPQLAELGLRAAQSYAKIAPAAPHALHMPSHIFARLGLWQDDIDSNLASIAATRRTAAMHMGGASHQLHAMDFLQYAYLQCGREADAKKLTEELDTLRGVDGKQLGYTKIQFVQRYAFELHHWQEAVSLPIAPDAKPGMKALVYWGRAIGEARAGNAAAARKGLERIKAIQKSMTTASEKYESDALTAYIEGAEPWVLHAEHQDKEAIALLRARADKEDKIGEEQDMSSREMLADMLLELRRPEEALPEYEVALKLNPNRFNSLYGAASSAEMAGKNEKATTYYAQLVKVCAGSNSDRPELGRAKALLAKK
jgi:tetratricopeptide (TPR) repeat protein